MTGQPEKINPAYATAQADLEEGVVFQTSVWTEERGGGGPGMVYRSFLDALASFDLDGAEYLGWKPDSGGEWNPEYIRHTLPTPEVCELDEGMGHDIPRVIPTKVLEKGEKLPEPPPLLARDDNALWSIGYPQEYAGPMPPPEYLDPVPEFPAEALFIPGSEGKGVDYPGTPVRTFQEARDDAGPEYIGWYEHSPNLWRATVYQHNSTLSEPLNLVGAAWVPYIRVVRP